MSTLVDELLQMPLCKEMTTNEASALVDIAVERNLAPGAYLCHGGDQGDSLFVILEGTLEVTIGDPASGEAAVATVGQGQVAGEIEMLTHSLRVASLRSKMEARVLELPGDKVEELIAANHPAINKLMRSLAITLARRLVTANNQVLSRIKQAQPPAPPPTVSDEPEELDATELMEIDDDDLDVLDKLWS